MKQVSGLPAHGREGGADGVVRGYLRLIDFVYHSTLGLRVINASGNFAAISKALSVQISVQIKEFSVKFPYVSKNCAGKLIFTLFATS